MKAARRTHRLRPALALAVATLTTIAPGAPLRADSTEALPAAPEHLPVPFAAPDRELMVPVPGGRVYVRINGELGHGATPAVFIHGGPGGTHDVFLETLGLAADRPVILYDQLDSGRSDHPNDPKNWKLERFVKALEAIRVALGIQSWHVVGHSWGSAIALRYSAEYPGHVASTVLGGTFISTPAWIRDANALIGDLPQDTQKTLAACDRANPPPKGVCRQATLAFYAAFNRREAPSPAAQAYDRTRQGERFNSKIYNAMWGPSEFRATGTLRTYDDTALLGRIDGTKTLFMIGQHDEARIPTVLAFSRETSGSELAVVPGAAHNFFDDRPAETEAILRAWFARHDTTKP